MRADVMVWIGRLVAAVFGLGVLALVAAVVVLVRRAEGVPAMPIFGGIVAMAMLVLLAGACLALMSLAVSAKRGVRALEAIAAGSRLPVEAQEAPPASSAPEGAVPAEAAPEQPVQGPFRAPGLREAAMAAPARPARPAGRVLVAER